MGKHIGKVFKKNSKKPKPAYPNNASCYTATDGFLEHSLSAESLYYKEPTIQKIILGFWGLPQIYVTDIYSSTYNINFGVDSR